MYNMPALKLLTKLQKFCFVEAASTVQRAWNPKTFVTATPTLKGDHKKETEAANKTIEQAEAVKDSAREVRKTCEFVRDTGSSMVKMTKEATEKVSEAAETVKDTVNSTYSGVLGTAKTTSDFVKDKIGGD